MVYRTVKSKPHGGVYARFPALDFPITERRRSRKDILARERASENIAYHLDAFYDKGSIRVFPLKGFLNDGAPLPKVVGRPVLFRKMTFFCVRRPWDYYSSEGSLIFCSSGASGNKWCISIEAWIPCTTLAPLSAIEKTSAEKTIVTSCGIDASSWYIGMLSLL